MMSRILSEYFHEAKNEYLRETSRNSRPVNQFLIGVFSYRFPVGVYLLALGIAIPAYFIGGAEAVPETLMRVGSRALLR